MSTVIAAAGAVITNYDSDFQANVLDVATTNGYTLPSKEKRIYLNRLMYDLKNIGLYAECDTFVNFALNSTGLGLFSLIDWKREGVLYTSHGGVAFTNYGWEGDGSSGYIETGFNPATDSVSYAQNDASRGMVVHKAATGVTAQYILDCISTTNNINTLYNISQAAQRINQGSATLEAAVNMGGTGLKTITRESSTVVKLVNKEVETSATATSSAVANGVQRLLGRSDAYSTAGLSCYFLGGRLEYSQIQAFRVAFNRLYASLGLEQRA